MQKAYKTGSILPNAAPTSSRSTGDAISYCRPRPRPSYWYLCYDKWSYKHVFVRTLLKYRRSCKQLWHSETFYNLLYLFYCIWVGLLIEIEVLFLALLLSKNNRRTSFGGVSLCYISMLLCQCHLFYNNVGINFNQHIKSRESVTCTFEWLEKVWSLKISVFKK